jgi:hypothetical protein
MLPGHRDRPWFSHLRHLAARSRLQKDGFGSRSCRVTVTPAFPASIRTCTCSGRRWRPAGCDAIRAEFETNRRRERQLESIAAAKARGVYTGRKLQIDPAAMRRLREQGKLGPSATAKCLGIGRASVYRLLDKTAA